MRARSRSSPVLSSVFHSRELYFHHTTKGNHLITRLITSPPHQKLQKVIKRFDQVSIDKPHHLITVIRLRVGPKRGPHYA